VRLLISSVAAALGLVGCGREYDCEARCAGGPPQVSETTDASNLEDAVDQCLGWVSESTCAPAVVVCNCVEVE
jgi:hypothetical protein